jgi:sugar phosphate isomerase/epimerase
MPRAGELVNELCLNLLQYSPYVGVDVSLDDVLDASAQAGFGLVGLDVYALDAAGLASGALSKRLDAHGLSCFEMLGLDVGDDDAAAIEMATSAARWVEQSGASFVLTIVSAPVTPEVVDRFGRCAELVVAAGGRLALEFLPFCPVNSIVAAQHLCDAVGYERAAVLVDSWHVFRGPDSLTDVAALDASTVAYVQFDDALPVQGELHDEIMSRRVWPGDGEFPLHDFAGAVRACGYTGPISVEVLNAEWRDAGLSPHAFAMAAKSSAQRYWS